MKKILVLCAAILISLTMMGQEKSVIRVGVDASVDCFETSGDRISTSIGLGALARLGSRDQWLNLVGGLRYIYGTRLSGFQVPLLVNLNLLQGGRASAYLGAGYEFDFIGSMLGCAKYQIGLSGGQIDMRIFYKPYQGDLGVGLTFYF